MASSRSRQRSLASLAKSLDTSKRALPSDAKAAKVALRPGAVESLKRELKARSAAEVKPGSGLRAPGSGGTGRATRASSAPAASRASSASATRTSAARTTGVGASRAPAARIAATSSARPPRSSPVPPVPRQKPLPKGSAPRVWSSPASARSSAPASRSPEPGARSPNRPSPKSTSVGRSSALASMAKKPSPQPSSMPMVGMPVGDARRRYPRADIQVRSRLLLDGDESRSFEATLSTQNISVGGMFLSSTFFLKLGTPLLVELTLPNSERVVRVRGEVVRVETQANATGFALRFTEYLDGSEVVLATHFLSPLLREFITEYAKQHRFEANAEYIAHTADVLAAWELRKAELGADVWSLVGP